MNCPDTTPNPILLTALFSDLAPRINPHRARFSPSAARLAFSSLPPPMPPAPASPASPRAALECAPLTQRTCGEVMKDSANTLKKATTVASVARLDQPRTTLRACSSTSGEFTVEATPAIPVTRHYIPSHLQHLAPVGAAVLKDGVGGAFKARVCRDEAAPRRREERDV